MILLHFMYDFISQAYLLEELFSPLITPFILCFSLRHQSLQIVDFFRNFTVDVAGVGDVCSFAQMDIKKHGNPQVRLKSDILVLVHYWEFVYFSLVTILVYC